MSRILHQCAPFLSKLSVFAMKKGYLPVFSDIITLKLINLFAGKTPTKFFMISSSLRFFIVDSIWKFDIPSDILSVKELSLYFFYSIVGWIWFQYLFYFILFYYFYTRIIYCWCLFDSFLNSFFSKCKINNPWTNVTSFFYIAWFKKPWTKAKCWNEQASALLSWTNRPCPFCSYICC